MRRTRHVRRFRRARRHWRELARNRRKSELTNFRLSFSSRVSRHELADFPCKKYEKDDDDEGEENDDDDDDDDDDAENANLGHFLLQRDSVWNWNRFQKDDDDEDFFSFSPLF